MKKRTTCLIIAVFAMLVSSANAYIRLDAWDTATEGTDVYSVTASMKIGNQWVYYPSGYATNEWKISGGVDSGYEDAWNTEFSVTLSGIALVNTNAGTADWGAIETAGPINQAGTGYSYIGVWTGVSAGIDAYQGLAFGVDAGNLDTNYAFKIRSVKLAYLGGGSQSNETGVIINRTNTGKYKTFGAVGTGTDFEYSGTSAWCDVQDLDIYIAGGTSNSTAVTVYRNDDGSGGSCRVMGYLLDVRPASEIPLPPNPKPDPSILSLMASGGISTLSVSNLSSASYVSNTLQVKTNLTDTSWTDLYSITGVTETNLALPDVDQGFFRIYTTY